MSRERTRPRVVVLHGVLDASRPDERDTLIEAHAVASALERLGAAVEIAATGLDLTVVDRIARTRPAAVFNLVESLDGEGRLGHVVPAVLAARGLRYTGTGTSGLLVTTDKLLAKRMMAAAGIPTAVFWSEGEARKATGTVIVKSVWEDASLGIDRHSVVGGAEAQRLIALRRRQFGGEWFAERYIDGREFNLSVVEGPRGPEVLPLAEIHFRDFPPDRPRIVDYEAKWIEGSFAFHNTPRRFLPAGSEEPLARRLRALALSTFRLFGLSGYARIDFRLDAEGNPFVIEANANPCIAPDAGLVAAAAEAGIDYDRLVARILVAAGLRTIGRVPCERRLAPVG
jgi:D-alanine-D-alanine ligase